MNVLVVDVGGTNVKIWLSNSDKSETFESGENLAPERMVARVSEIVQDWAFDVVALGLPCRIIAGRPVEEPHNLGSGWIKFDYEKAFGKPVRMLNDADLQALGLYQGGRMLFLGLGTGVGSSLLAPNTLISIDAGALYHANGKLVSYLLNRAARKRMGTKKWQQMVHSVVKHLKEAMFVDEVVIGGGQADKLTDLPEGSRSGHNSAVIEGGVRLWSDLPDHDHQPTTWRIV